MIHFWTYFLPTYPLILLFMLQRSGYVIKDYLRWLHRTEDFRKVMKRQRIVWTMKVRMLLLTQVVILAGMITLAVWSFEYSYWFSLACVLGLPLVLAYGTIIPVILGDYLIQKPRIKRMEKKAQKIIEEHPGKKIAIAGSYGKTTAKEVIGTVLSQKFSVAMTPSNMNTPIGISRFAQTLTGDEEVLIFELGETHVGDIRHLCEIVQPDVGVITGINEAHLDTFGTIENTVHTIFELQNYVGIESTYKNTDSDLVLKEVKDHDMKTFGKKGAGGWRASDPKISIEGTKFELKRHKKIIKVSSKLLGEHNIGVLSLAASMANDMGMKVHEIEQGLHRTEPFEHRMKPYKLHDAWIIDDTYNGNIEGALAGIKLLKKLRAKRRVYVTPGLVEQGHMTKHVHEEIGKALAHVADVVVLMRNSVTDYIESGLHSYGYKGEIEIIAEPQKFYDHLEHFVIDGDVVLMQNDWTDNYE